MIPYVEIPPLPLFGWQVHPFEILLAASFLVGAHLCARRAPAFGIPRPAVYDGAILSVVFGLLGARFFHLFAYDFPALRADPASLLRVTGGLSSYGGFLGAGLAVWIYVRRKKLPVLRMADLAMYGVLPAFLVGRLGCFAAHDHPGTRSSFFLAVRYPGGPRHDLGFYEMLLAAGMSAVIHGYFGRRRGRFPDGAEYAFALLAYGAARFLLDFLRAADLPGADARYFGWTPAQFASLGFLALGAGVLWRPPKKSPE